MGERGNNISGILFLNKRPGVTSFEALGDIKRALGTGRVGHTGTLDKFAGGLLVVLAGRALKLSPWFAHCDKRYEGTIRFGAETDSLDGEGRITAEAPLPEAAAVEAALSRFRGRILQVPPAYSALHIGGRRASELAREGKTPAMQARFVHVHSLELLSWEPPCARIAVHCSGGTYIRSLARDIALAAGSRGHLHALTRTAVAGFPLSLGIDSGEGPPGLVAASLRSVDRPVIAALGLPFFEVNYNDVQKIIHGKPLSSIIYGEPRREEGAYGPPETDAGDQAGPAAAGGGTEIGPPCSGAVRRRGPVACAVFCGPDLAGIIEGEPDQGGYRWRYGCVCAEKISAGESGAERR
ncbi:MAG: tRNA pseudouridine(55) synthase TruB [Treponema sp.]|jgi:tRNA pseudouridine55 synthase|nr:tRNA pseudouridine(55) synthase TruB [Treponema sp.]